MTAALALKCQINFKSQFDRKHYFYHDLPAGYQLTQKFQPIATDGQLALDTKVIRIRQLHLEQDTARTLVSTDELTSDNTTTKIDLNRAGAPLIEIVTDPDFNHADDVVAFLCELQAILRTLDVSKASMDDGCFRVDVNVSVHTSDTDPGVRTELKNLASLRVIKDALDYEIQRHHRLISGENEDGDVLVPATRSFDAAAGRTLHLRLKETDLDYRYFPDPDLPPLRLRADHVDRLRAGMPELPQDRRSRFHREYGLSDHHIRILCSDHRVASYFEQVVRHLQDVKAPEASQTKTNAQTASNWLTNTLFGVLTQRELNLFPSSSSSSDPVVSADQLASVIQAVQQHRMATHQGKAWLEHVLDHPYAKLEDALLGKTGFQVGFIEAELLKEHVREVARSNPKGIAQLGGRFPGGAGDNDMKKKVKLKPAVLTWFAGQVMRRIGGQADPDQLKTVLRQIFCEEYQVPMSVFEQWDKK